MDCPFCRANVADTAHFCRDCGALLRPNPCPECGIISDPAATACAGCGATLSGMPADARPASENTPSQDASAIEAQIDDLLDELEALASVTEPEALTSVTGPVPAEPAPEPAAAIPLVAPAENKAGDAPTAVPAPRPNEQQDRKSRRPSGLLVAGLLALAASALVWHEYAGRDEASISAPVVTPAPLGMPSAEPMSAAAEPSQPPGTNATEAAAPTAPQPARPPAPARAPKPVSHSDTASSGAAPAPARANGRAAPERRVASDIRAPPAQSPPTGTAPPRAPHRAPAPPRAPVASSSVAPESARQRGRSARETRADRAVIAFECHRSISDGSPDNGATDESCRPPRPRR